MFKKRYKIIEKTDAATLAKAVELEMHAEGWIPLGGAIWLVGDTYRWAQTMWLPEDPHVTGLVPSKEEEFLAEDNIGLSTSLEFVGKPPAGQEFNED